MPNSFDTSNSPFDRLTPQEGEQLRAAIDIEYFRPEEVLIPPETQAQHLYVVIKGAVEERDSEGELAALLGPGDSFDSRAMMQGSGPRSFVAREETLCYLMPRDLVLALIQKNPRFGSFFYLDISRKLDELARDDDESRFGTLMRARIRDLFLHPAEFITAEDTIETAGHKMREIDSNALYVRDGDRVGIITGMNLSKAVVLRRMPISDPVRAVTHFDLVSIDADDFVFSALISMTKHNKRRLAVTENGKFIGILEDIDLLSFLAGNSQLVAGRIDRASSVADLTVAAADIAGQVRMLRRQGVKAEVVAEIISDLNRRLLAKLFQFLAPPDLRAKSCLIVMGSEGRGEQTVRTDQDNGLILSEPVDEAVLDEFRVAFTDALEKFGFPPCPGNVMVRNPLWSKPLSEYLADFHRWIALPDADSHMNVAIFYDADAVAGKVTLLDEAKRALISKVQGERVYLAHFAKAIEAFPTPIGFFNNLITSAGAGDAVDLKKGGIFPIVHGVRSLAIERGITETSTAGRISKLIEIGALKPEFGRELTQALQFLISLRLDSQLAETGGLMKPAALSSMERDLLRDSFQVVKQFREIVRRHFNLSMFG
jgi:CBS domain-containing protein